MARKRLAVLLPAAIFLFGAFRCSLPWAVDEPEDILVVAYNVHNLFDAEESGREYPEFKPSNGSWNQELYSRRLDLVAEVFGSICPERGRPPDILCLSEVENEKVLEDLARGPLKAGNYRWAFSGGPPDSPVRCGILSRFPILSARAHASSTADFPGSGRDMLEVNVDLRSPGRRSEPGTITIFLCHWKSRIEGKERTEPARRAAAGLLASRIEELSVLEPSGPVLVCGDFNESPDEFERSRRAYPTALMPADEAESLSGSPWLEDCLLVARSRGWFEEGGAGALFSPWEGSGGYSYVFKGERERLDGFLLNGALLDGAGIEFVDFFPVEDARLLSPSGEPLAWNGSSGYSDHLPIALRLERLSFDKSR